MHKNGELFIISGPSGSGKDTLIQLLLKRCPNIKISISTVTRKPRDNEQDGVKYDFVSVETFKEMIDNDDFLEYAEYIGNYYGTRRSKIEEWLSEGKNVILEIEVNGAEIVNKKMPQAKRIFIMPPTYKVLVERLIDRRTEDMDIAKKRLEQAIVEIEAAKKYDYTVINENLDVAVSELCGIINKDCNNMVCNNKIIEEVLCDAKSFNWEAYSKL